MLEEESFLVVLDLVEGAIRLEPPILIIVLPLVHRLEI